MLFRTLCFEYRIVEIRYFLDEMTSWEAADVVRNLGYVDKNEREIGRYQLYVAIQSNSKKKYEPKDIMALPWDPKPEKYDEEKGKRLIESAKAFENMLNSGAIKFDHDDHSKELFKNTPKHA